MAEMFTRGTDNRRVVRRDLNRRMSQPSLDVEFRGLSAVERATKRGFAIGRMPLPRSKSALWETCRIQVGEWVAASLVREGFEVKGE